MVNKTNIVTALYAGRQSSQPGFPSASEVIASWNYAASRDVGPQLFGTIGLSNASPDNGFGFNGTYKF